MGVDEHAHDAKPVDHLAKSLPSEVFKPGALKIITGVAVGLLLGGCGVVYAQSVKSEAKEAARAAADAGVASVSAELAQFKAETNARMARIESKQDEQTRLTAVKEERDAARFDVIYGTILSGRKDPRADALAAPIVPDGGK